MDTERLDKTILALLFASEEPLSVRKLTAVLEEVEVQDVHASVRRLSELYHAENSSVVLERVAGGLQLATNPEYAKYVARLYSGRRKQRLSKAGMEVLAIISYKQPITRAEIEQIRGVGCGGVITTLMERSLINITGKAKVLGAPFLYGTTQEFLEYLGLNSLKDLPSLEEFEVLLEREEREASDASEKAGGAGEDNEEEISLQESSDDTHPAHEKTQEWSEAATEPDEPEETARKVPVEDPDS